MKIIIDAFGGDNAPTEVLKGAALAVKEYGVEIILTGNETIIKDRAKQEGISLDKIEIVNATTVMPVEEDAGEIIKSYSDSSMAVGLKLLAEGKGDAFVGAGSTGAMVMGSTFIVKRLKGIKRVAIGALVPTLTDNGAYLLLDAGANHECRAEMLTQFAVMGSAYMNKIEGRVNPKVGLINIGAEETKGLPLHIKAYSQLKNAPINFIGNMEGRDMPLGECDVAVCDGYTGNIVLKVTEGMGKSFSNTLKKMLTRTFFNKISAAILLKDIKEMREKNDYASVGGAPLLGLRKPVIKAHGSSHAVAFKNAIRQAKLCCEREVIPTMEKALSELKIVDEPEEA